MQVLASEHTQEHNRISENADFVVKEHIPNKINLSKWTVNLPVLEVVMLALTSVVEKNQKLITLINEHNTVEGVLPITIPKAELKESDLIIFSALYGINFMEELKFFENNISTKLFISTVCYNTKLTILEIIETDIYKNENAKKTLHKHKYRQNIIDLANRLQAKKYLLLTTLNNLSILINFKQFHFLEYFDSRFRSYMAPSGFKQYVTTLCSLFII